ncbi:unnamed protein product [Phytophthora fragariaefolia]|uniref:Unnamed protein product n=1 Tax=Phytophthora fragariaefolia TaxID=1490495 RepID=A0A9W6Y8G2_9STRA|nr:unnamed protein product [Phytophthora fragariaefolia]
MSSLLGSSDDEEAEDQNACHDVSDSDYVSDGIGVMASDTDDDLNQMGADEDPVVYGIDSGDEPAEDDIVDEDQSSSDDEGNVEDTTIEKEESEEETLDATSLDQLPNVILQSNFLSL